MFRAHKDESSEMPSAAAVNGDVASWWRRDGDAGGSSCRLCPEPAWPLLLEIVHLLLKTVSEDCRLSLCSPFSLKGLPAGAEKLFRIAIAHFG